jgi:hypothetical protein
MARSADPAALWQVLRSAGAVLRPPASPVDMDPTSVSQKRLNGFGFTLIDD